MYALWRPAPSPDVIPIPSPPITPSEPPAPPDTFPELEDPADFLADPPSPPAAPTRDATPGATHTARYKNLTRVDRAARNLHGYHVRLTWKGAVYQKWFSDAAHEDRRAALAAALAWRNAKEHELGKPRTERLLKGRDATSNTGIVGVARVVVKGRPYYRALWRDAEGKMHRRWFSIEALGEQHALRAAIRTHDEEAALRL